MCLELMILDIDDYRMIKLWFPAWLWKPGPDGKIPVWHVQHVTNWEFKFLEEGRELAAKKHAQAMEKAQSEEAKDKAALEGQLG